MSYSDKTPRLLLIGGWTPIYEKAKACGWHVTLFQDKARIKPEDFALVDQVMTLRLDDPRMPDYAALLHEDTPFDAVVSFQEFGLLNAAVIKERLGLRGNPLLPVRLTRDKEQMRQHLLEKGLRQLPFQVVSTVEDVTEFANRVGYPIILKSSKGAGSIQIHKLESAEGAAEALARIQQAFPEASVLAERFVTGPEISVESFSCGGEHTVVAVTDKVTTSAPFFVETGHSEPSALSADVLEQVKALTVAFLSSIGHEIGPAHTEMIVTEDGPYIIESHTRCGGDYIYELVEHAYGVDLFLLTYRSLLGEEVQAKDMAQGAAAIRYLLLPEGVVQEIAGVEEAKALSGIERIEIDVQVGQQTKGFTNSTERFGCVLARGETVADALTKIEQAFAHIRVVVE